MLQLKRGPRQELSHRSHSQRLAHPSTLSLRLVSTKEKSKQTMAYSLATWLTTCNPLITAKNPCGTPLSASQSHPESRNHLSLTASKLFDIQILENKKQRQSTILSSPDCLKPHLLSSDFLAHALSQPKSYKALPHHTPIGGALILGPPQRSHV